jgi:RNA polymerase sigma-70 factor (ECF subfamily)
LAPATWDAFRLTALENRPAAEVAKLLGKQVCTVYSLRSKVQKLLQEDVQWLQKRELNSNSDDELPMTGDGRPE